MRPKKEAKRPAWRGERGRRGKKVFFHISVAAEGWSPQQGDAVTFEVGTDARGRPE